MKIFIVYSREDEVFKNQLLKHLEPLKIKEGIETWDDSQIIIGEKWDNEIRRNLKESSIILFMVSSDSIASEYINDVELKEAYAKAEKGDAVLVPIIIRPCLWAALKIGEYQVLPKGGTPITDEYWANRDLAYLNIAEELEKLIEHLKRQKTEKDKEQNASNEYFQDNKNKRQSYRISDYVDMYQMREIYNEVIHAKIEMNNFIQYLPGIAKYFRTVGSNLDKEYIIIFEQFINIFIENISEMKRDLWTSELEEFANNIRSSSAALTYEIKNDSKLSRKFFGTLIDLGKILNYLFEYLR